MASTTEKIRIVGEKQRGHAIDLINKLTFDKVHIVIIKPHSETELDRQRALYFRWVRIMGDHAGYEVDEMHLELKKQFLIPILYEENDTYREWVDTYNDLLIDRPSKAKVLLNVILAATSVKDKKMVTKAIMVRYMKRVERHSNQNDCFLPRPGENY